MEWTVAESDNEFLRSKPEDPIRITFEDGYSLWANSDGDGGNALIELEESEVEGFLPDVSDRRVLGVGAGTGRYALKRARQGEHVTGTGR